MAVDADHNKVDPQAPTEMDLPAPVFFPALFHHERVSHSNHFHLPFFPIPFPWSSFYQMARPSRSEPRDRKVQPPRPPNAWILYRSFHFKLIRQRDERLSQASVSKIISEMWKHETEEVKRDFEQQAEARKAQHQELYPDYRFCPKRKEAKRSRKKSKSRDATPEDADVDNEDNDDAPPAPPVPAFPHMSYAHQPQPQFHPPFVPGYHHNMMMPPWFHLIPESRYGPAGPSPPLSAAPSPSPAPRVGSQSPQQPSVASTSSSPSSRLSPGSESQASSSSSQLSANPMPLPSLPNSHHPSPNPYATLPLSILLFQNSALGELPMAPPRIQPPSPENTFSPSTQVWNDISTCLPSPENSEEVVNLDLAINQTQTLAELQQALPAGPTFDSLLGLLSSTDENGVFNLSNVEPSMFNRPRGDLEVMVGYQDQPPPIDYNDEVAGGYQDQPPTIDYSDDYFAEFNFDRFEQTDSLTAGCALLAQEDLQSLFHTPSNPELQSYMAARQRQPSAFTQDMMSFLNFEAAEDSVENTSSTVSPAPVATVAPQQVRLQSPPAAPAMPIFTQMTNAPTVASGSSYVPPAGAINSSTRRVAGSWKPSFVVPGSQMDEPVPTWNL